MEKEIKYWALYYSIYDALKKKAYSFKEACKKFRGEQHDAVIYFNNYLQKNES
jgi:hypothetical protein